MKTRAHSDVTLAYAAGYLDGEGCFGSNAKGRFALICENTHKPTILWLQETFGGKVINHARKTKPQWRPSWRWELHDTKAAELAAILLPFLREKKEQAAIFLQLQATRGSGRLSLETIETRKQLALELKRLKHVSHF